jgi:SAM-dependent methyltransferase
LRWIREVEIDLVLRNIAPYVGSPLRRLRVLEFGAGDCYQAKRLASLGSTTASDTGLPEARGETVKNITFVVAGIDSAPFKTGSFDLVFSNHVLEHLSDIKASLSEAKRIAKPDALFVFTVPTRFWLLMAQPAEVGWKIAWLRRSLRRDGLRALKEIFRSSGHGEFTTFGSAFSAFAPSNWSRVLETNGFRILAQTPLLAYAPSELLLPPSRRLVRLGLYSSLLFVLKNADVMPAASTS